jgi:phosphoglycerate dehydrogenase-like enzyme
MNEVNVMVTTPVGDRFLREIADVSPRVKVWDISGMAKAEQEGRYRPEAESEALLARADVIYGLRLPQGLAARAPRLRWIQVMSAGVDRFLAAGVPTSVTLTNVSGIHATPIGEFVMEQMLMFAKRASLCFEMKQRKEWRRYTPSVLRGKTVGIVGLGSIGREVARLSRAFGMRVVATRRSTKQETRARYVDRLLPRQQLAELLAESDFVVITLPYTEETDGLIGQSELRMMKSTAYLINIGRGRIIDEEALVQALSAKDIAGAGLDVFATEPLPRDSKLWDLPNVLFSPPVSGGMEDYNVHPTAVLCDNLRRFLEGRRLRNVVNKRRGY